MNEYEQEEILQDMKTLAHVRNLAAAMEKGCADIVKQANRLEERLRVIQFRQIMRERGVDEYED